jgi:hypothetical protein
VSRSQRICSLRGAAETSRVGALLLNRAILTDRLRRPQIARTLRRFGCALTLRAIVGINEGELAIDIVLL